MLFYMVGQWTVAQAQMPTQVPFLFGNIIECAPIMVIRITDYGSKCEWAEFDKFFFYFNWSSFLSSVLNVFNWIMSLRTYQIQIIFKINLMGLRYYGTCGYCMIKPATNFINPCIQRRQWKLSEWKGLKNLWLSF
jgi:hypothetical protein